MLIEPGALQHWIEHFYGYGSWNAPFWFIAAEESGGDVPEDVSERLNFFASVSPEASAPTLCDVREMYRHIGFRFNRPKASIYKTQYDYRFGDTSIQHAVWKNLIAFIAGFTDTEMPDPLSYQRKQLASPVRQREALIKLYPLPSPHNHAWYYSWLNIPDFDFLRSRTTYEQALYESRTKAILTQIARYKPQLVLMYGMKDINRLKKSFHDHFDAVAFKMVKAIKMQIPQYHVATIGATLVIITTQVPALRHNRIETGFDWFEFARSVKDVNRANLPAPSIQKK